MHLFKICLLVIVYALLSNLDVTVADDAVAGPAVKRLSLRRPTAQAGKSAKPSTTTTTESLQNEGDEGDYQDGEQDNQYPDEEENAALVSSTTTTTTEAPKRIGPVIRPFRSNDDFLNSLKRRQQNAKKNKPEKPAALNKNVQDSQETAETAQVASATGSTGKTFNKPSSTSSRRKFNKPTKPVAEEVVAEEGEPEKKADAKPKRPAGRLASRKFN